MKIRYLRWATAMLLAVVVCVVAERSEAKAFPEINAEQLKERMDAGEELLLLNPLSKIEFEDKHIPGSVNIPLQNILVAENLPENKDHLIVTYCLGRK